MKHVNILSIIILFFGCILISAAGCQQDKLQPNQPSTGPGGSDYAHANVIFSDYTDPNSGEGYWLFEPAAPVKDSAPLIIFNHGLNMYNPAPYGAWIKHMVLKGNIVVYPKYQKSITSPAPPQYTINAANAIKDAINELTLNPNRTNPILSNFGIMGHSYGGVISANLLAEYQLHGIPKPKFALLCQPGHSIITSGRIPSYSGIEPDIKLLMVVGENDLVVGDSFAREIFTTTSTPSNIKNLVTHNNDLSGEPEVRATHQEPLAKDLAYDGGIGSLVITTAYGLSKEDAVDYYCYWKFSDAIMDCSFENTNCNYAFGNTYEQKFLGTWSDGQDINYMTVEQ